MQKMSLENKERWALHCEKHYVPLYFRPWWMDCVCGADNWGVCLSLDGGGNLEGGLVFYLKRRLGLTAITMPPLTAYSGLWLSPPDNLVLSSSRMAFEKRVCGALIAQLPPPVYFFQQWHPAIMNWLPFYWKGFRQTTHYTYLLDLFSDKEKMRNFLKGSARAHIHNAEKKVTVKYTDNISLLYNLYSKSLKRQQIKPGFNFETLKLIDAYLTKSKSRAILCAADSLGNLHAAIYLIWDEKCTYFILSGADPAFRQSQAMSLLLWEAIKTNPGQTRFFDFEGAMLEPVERFFRSFGGALTPHFQIAKASNRLVKTLGVLLNKGF